MTDTLNPLLSAAGFSVDVGTAPSTRSPCFSSASFFSIVACSPSSFATVESVDLVRFSLSASDALLTGTFPPLLTFLFKLAPDCEIRLESRFKKVTGEAGDDGGGNLFSGVTDGSAKVKAETDVERKERRFGKSALRFAKPERDSIQNGCRSH